MNGTGQLALGVPDEAPGYVFTLTTAVLLFLAATSWFVYALLTEPSAQAWGYLVVNFLYVLGVSQFGIAFCALMRLCGAKWAAIDRTTKVRTFFAFAPGTAFETWATTISGFLPVARFTANAVETKGLNNYFCSAT